MNCVQRANIQFCFLFNASSIADSLIFTLCAFALPLYTVADPFLRIANTPVFLSHAQLKIEIKNNLICPYRATFML